MEISPKIIKKEELNLRFQTLSEDIRAVLKDLSIASTNFEKLSSKRILTGLEEERSTIEDQLYRLEEGTYLPFDLVLEKDFRRIKKQSELEIDKNNKKGLKIVNSKPFLIIDNFQDRIKEISDLKRHLIDENVSLISILGSTGGGKTALLCKVFKEIEKSFKVIYEDKEIDINGIIYLDAKLPHFSLDEIFTSFQLLLNNNGDISSIVLKSALLDESSNLEQKINMLFSALRGRTYYLVIDNFETILDEHRSIKNSRIRKFFDCVISSTCGIVIILTSQVNLDLSPIFKQRTRKIPVRKLPENDAINYLRKLDPEGDFGISYESDGQLAKIANLVHCNPRALEMVATLMSTRLDLSIEKFIKDKDLFVGEILENLFNETYSHLNIEEKAICQCLAIFGKPIEFTGVAFVANHIKPLDANEVIKRLIDKYLVIGKRKEKKYGLDTSYKDFVLRTIPYEQKELLNKLCGEYYQQISLSEEHWKSFNEIEPIIFSIFHFLDGRDFEKSSNELARIEKYLERWGKYRLALSFRLKLKGNLSNGEDVCINNLQIGKIYGFLGKTELSFQYLENAHKLSHKIKNIKLKTKILSSLGLRYLSLHNFKVAKDYFEKSRSYAEDNNYKDSLAHIYGLLANTYRRLGDETQMSYYFNKAIELDRKNGDHKGLSRRLLDFGISSYFEGELEEAKTYFFSSLEISRSIHYINLMGYAIGNLAKCFLAENKIDRAIRYSKMALRINEQTGSKRSQARNLATLGNTYFRMGKINEALDCHLDAKTLAFITKDSDGICIWSINTAIDFLILKKNEESISLFNKIFSDFQGLIETHSQSHKMTSYFYAMAKIIHAVYVSSLQIENLNLKEIFDFAIPIIKEMKNSGANNTIGKNIDVIVNKVEKSINIDINSILLETRSIDEVIQENE
jgi:tetratricopeptide (TPR) repeat protein